MKNFKSIFSFLALLFCMYYLSAQEVPYGINYQAVARNSIGEELVNSQVDIKFSVISGNPLGVLEYQEVHYGVATSRYGVFTAIIGNGTPVAGEKEMLRDLTWEADMHYLKVEIKFSSDYQEVGTMQFLSVPYALYAGRSLEPGPTGPPGPAGDPATDDQNLSFDGENLSIDGGNEVNLANLLNVEDDDSDPINEIQDLDILDDILKITKNGDAHQIDLSPYKDNTDAQTLSFVAATNTLSISNGNSTSLADLANTDEQQLSYDNDNYELSLGNGGTVNIGALVAFRAERSLSEIGLNIGTNYDFIPTNVFYNDGLGYNAATGEFTAPISGIYTFNIGYLANGSQSGRQLHIFLNGSLYETLNNTVSGGEEMLLSCTLKLSLSDVVKVVLNTGLSTESGTGSFSGFRVY